MRHLRGIAFTMLFGAGLALAQTGMQSPQTRPPTTPPTFPSQQQQPPIMQHPDENAGQSGAASTTMLPKAQADIQTALRRQLPASADSVTVGVTDDNKIQLSGNVTSDTEKNQIEQVARSAAPDMSIVNKLTVANPPLAPTAVPPAGMQPPPINPEGKMGTEKPTQPNSSQPMPPMGSSFMAPQSSSSPNSGSMSTPAPQANSAANSADAQGSIQKAIQQDPTLAGANITVTVVNNTKVELTGTVANKDQKKTAKQIAESNAGGMKVIDHLKVEGSNPPTKY